MLSRRVAVALKRCRASSYCVIVLRVSVLLINVSRYILNFAFPSSSAQTFGRKAERSNRGERHRTPKRSIAKRDRGCSELKV